MGESNQENWRDDWSDYGYAFKMLGIYNRIARKLSSKDVNENVKRHKAKMIAKRRKKNKRK